MIDAQLKVVGGKHAGQVLALNRKKFLIGREQDCQLRPNSEMVSRHHCVFSVDDFSVRLRDLGSTNGTLVNGERIRKETVLNAGDRVIIGNLEFELVLGGAATAAPSAAPAVSDPEDTVVGAGQDTVFEMPVVDSVDGNAADDVTPVPEEAAAVAAGEQQAPAAGQDPGMAQPPVSGSDTTVLQPGQMMQGQVPYQPNMMPPMGYMPPMYGQYPYQPGMPGFPGQYPQQMIPGMGYGMPGQPGYGQMPPQQPMPAQPEPQQQQPAASSGGASVDVSLPDPSETGAKEDAPVKGSGGSNKGDTAKPTGAADEIIKKYRQRLPGSGQG